MRSTFRALAVGTAVLSSAFGSAACNQNNDTVNPTSLNEPVVVDQFVGTLQPSGDAFYSFSMSKSGDVALTLISMTGPSVPSDALFPLGIGQPVGTGCTASVDAAASPGPAAQYKVTKTAGVYCVRVADNARLGAAANFVLNITHPR